MRRRFAFATAALALAVTAGPAFGINDGKVPADECSGQPSAVGTPGGGANPGIAQTSQVDPPVSGNNPGASTGAKGQANSQAIANC